MQFHDKDKTLMRLKDFILLALALVSFLSVVYKSFAFPLNIISKLDSVSARVEAFENKSIPTIESNMIKIAVLQSQLAAIKEQLNRIEEKLP